MRVRLIGCVAVSALVAMVRQLGRQAWAPRQREARRNDRRSGRPARGDRPTRDPGRRRRRRRRTRSAASTATAFDGVKAYFDMVNAKGGDLRAQARARLRARRPAGATTSRRSRRCLAQDDVFAVAADRRDAARSPAPSCSPTSGIPTFGWNINAECDREPRTCSASNRRVCASAASAQRRLPFVAEEAGRHEGRRPRVQRVEQSTDCADGHREVVREVPDRRRSCSTTRASRSAPPTSAPRSRR